MESASLQFFNEVSATRGRADHHGSKPQNWLSDLFFILPPLTVGQYCNLNDILWCNIKLLGKVRNSNKKAIYKKLFSLVFVSKCSVFFLLENYVCDVISS